MEESMNPGSQSPRRKYARLKDKEAYSTPGQAVHVIIGTRNGEPYFKDHILARGLLRILKELASEKDVEIHAYCIMPEHVHLVLGPSDKTGVIEFVRSLKGRFKAWSRGEGVTFFWQRSFYDHVLRKDGGVLEVVKYVLGNPVRGGLSEEAGDYPFAGSLVYDLGGGG
jgi:putative transposase